MTHFHRLEKHLENAGNNYYKKRMSEWLAANGTPGKPEGPLKLNTLGHRSYPDRQYFGPYGRWLLIEYKKLGEGPSDLQAYVHTYLNRLGHKVHVVDNIKDAKLLIDKLFIPEVVKHGR